MKHTLKELLAMPMEELNRLVVYAGFRGSHWLQLADEMTNVAVFGYSKNHGHSWATFDGIGDPDSLENEDVEIDGAPSISLPRAITIAYILWRESQSPATGT